MSQTLMCPVCRTPVSVTSTSEQAVCPQCRSTFWANVESGISVRPMDAAPPPVLSVRSGAPNVPAPLPYRDYSTPEDVMLPPQPPEGLFLGNVAVLLFVATIMTSMACIAVDWYAYTNLVEKDRAGVLDPEDDQWLTLLRMSSAMLNMACSLPAYVVFLVWKYSAYKNLQNFRCLGLEASPGWAAGSYFVPIISFYRPYLIMQEIWKGSDPQSEPYSANWSLGRGSSLISFWWFGYLVFCVTMVVIAMTTTMKNEPNLHEILVTLQAEIVTHAVSALTTLPLIGVILAITKRQREKGDGLLHWSASTAYEGPR